MKVKRKHVQHWNQPEQEIEGLSLGRCWNPHKGNVKVGNREMKWFNFISERK